MAAGEEVFGRELRPALDVRGRALCGDPAPTVAERADSSVNLVVRPWCAAGDEWGVRWDLTRKLEEELEADGCNIPFP